MLAALWPAHAGGRLIVYCVPLPAGGSRRRRASGPSQLKKTKIESLQLVSHLIPPLPYVSSSRIHLFSISSHLSTYALAHPTMAQEPGSTAAHVLSWYAKLRPLTVDIVGDFAGRELFLVNGESLLRYCLEESRVDYDGTCIAIWVALADSTCLDSLSISSSSRG
jgi:hypothetical protein